MTQPSLLDLMVALSSVSQRAKFAGQLADRLGVESVHLLLRDPAIFALIPAPGMPQTMRGGRSWRAFLSSCPDSGRYQAVVEFPLATQCSALALIHKGTSMVLLGGTPADIDIDELERVMPLFSALLVAEQRATLAQAESALAQETADRAQELASALELARSEAAALNAEFREEHRRKDEFLAMLGHELRNPLAPLVTAIDMLRIHPSGRELPEFVMDTMARQIAQLSRLVEDLLDVSRVSRGRIALQREPLLLADVLEDAYKDIRPLFYERQHQVYLSGLHLPLTVNADRTRLIQVFGNLLNNTAKYTNEGGRIILALSSENEYAVVRVTDNGIGIERENLPRVFELFAQASPALGRAEGGLGIGLTLVRALVQLHGGTINAESAGTGQGTSFTVCLPMIESQTHKATPETVGSTDLASKSSARVLIVDDNRDAADSIALLLRMKGHNVEVSYDGEAALQVPDRAQADLILLDIGLPGMNGYEVARKLRPQLKNGAHLVALTGYGTDEGRRRSHEAGFDAHVVKPITLDILDNLIKNSLVTTPSARSDA